MIWNLESAVSATSQRYPVNYHQYYCISPELLIQLDDEVDLKCCLRSDVYAAGLLMWQMSKRCSLYGMSACVSLWYVTPCVTHYVMQQTLHHYEYHHMIMSTFQHTGVESVKCGH